MITLTQLVLAISIPAVIALLGVLWNASATNRLGDRMDRMEQTLNARINSLGDRMDRMSENFTNQVTTLLQTIHGVDVRVVGLEEREKRKA